MAETTPLIRRLWGPAVLTGALALLYLFRQALGPAWASQTNQTYLLAALAFAAGITILRLVSFLLLDVWFRARKGRQAPQLLRLVISMVGYAVIIVTVYSGVLHKSLSTVAATSAVLTVILGLALQDTLGNFFAGISLHIEQPYHIGDALRVADVVGTVESVTWRTTTVRTNNNSLVIHPNSRIARDPIEVFTLNELNRRIMRFPAPYDIAPERVIGIVDRTAQSVPRVAAERQPVVRVAEFAESCITYEILFWIKDYMWAHDIEAAMRKRIWYALKRHGIDMPFPTRHILLEESRETGQPRSFEGFLSGIDILKPLGKGELKTLADSVVPRLYASGEIVIQTGEAAESMFVVHRGSAEVLAPDAGGNWRQLAVLGPGNVLGEMGLFTGEPRRADVRAQDELELLEIGKPVMKALLTENRSLAEAFSRIIAGRQAELTRHLESQAPGEVTLRPETILDRIRRFFTLSHD